MRSRVYVTVGCLSVSSIDRATAAGGIAAEHPMSRRYRQIAVGAILQAPALSSKRGLRHVESRWRRLNTDLFFLVENMASKFLNFVGCKLERASRL